MVFAEADVIGNEEIHARQPQRFPQWFELVGIEPDARTEGGLQEARVGGSDAVPAEGIEIGGEVLGRIETALGKPCPFFARQDGSVQLALPEDAELLPLRVVFDAGEFDERRILRPWTGRPGPPPSTVSGGRGRSGRLLGRRKSHSFRETFRPLRYRPQPALELGHHETARSGEMDVLLSLRDSGRVQPLCGGLDGGRR